MNSAKRFDIIRTIVSVLIALAISFVIIFMVSDQPLEAIKYLLIGPLTNKRSMGNVVESMIPLIFTGTGVCIMFSQPGWRGRFSYWRSDCFLYCH